MSKSKASSRCLQEAVDELLQHTLEVPTFHPKNRVCQRGRSCHTSRECSDSMSSLFNCYLFRNSFFLKKFCYIPIDLVKLTAFNRHIAVHFWKEIWNRHDLNSYQFHEQARPVDILGITSQLLRRWYLRLGTLICIRTNLSTLIL